MGDTRTIRVARWTRDRPRELADASGAGTGEVLDEAVEAYRPQLFLEELNAAYVDLRSDPEARDELRQELAEWDVTLGDGLEGI
jgi:hypothetical protein